MKAIVLRLLVIIGLLAIIVVPSWAGGTGELGFLSRPSIGGNQTTLQWIGIASEGNSTFSFLYVGRWVAPPITQSFNFGVVNLSSTNDTGLSNFTVTNFGQEAIDLAISGTDMIGGTSTWTLSDTATAGAATYGLIAGVNAYTVTVKKTAPFNDLTTNLGAGVSRTWGLRLRAPTSMTAFEAMAGNITLTVSIS